MAWVGGQLILRADQLGSLSFQIHRLAIGLLIMLPVLILQTKASAQARQDPTS